jgi:hypothetical protein
LPRVSRWLLLLVCVALAGCGESKIKGDDVESFIRSKFKNPGVVKSVSCPAERPAKKGDTFECTIEVKDGSQEIATIEQTDGDGHVRFAADRQSRLPTGTVTLKRENLEHFVSDQLPDVEAGTTKCPADEPVKAGHVTRCTVRSAKDGKVYVVSLLQFDKLGNVRISDVKPR